MASNDLNVQFSWGVVKEGEDGTERYREEKGGLAFSRKRAEPGITVRDRVGMKGLINARDFYGHYCMAIDDDKGNFNPLRGPSE